MDSPVSLSQYQAWKNQRREADQAYYYNDEPVLSDEEYDALVSQIRQWAPTFGEREEDSSVMAMERPENATEHPSRMWSINPVALENKEVLSTLFDGGGDIPAIVEPKMDGIAINLIYRDGCLVDALLRGDYFQGESVYHAVRYVDNIPRVVQDTGLTEVRGELMVLKKDFETANRLREKKGLPALANPRNAAAGAIRALDPKVFTERKLTFYAYDVGLCDIEFVNQLDVREWLVNQGFDVAMLRDSGAVFDVLHLQHVFGQVKKTRGTFPYELDGVVVKVYKRRQRLKLGEGRKAPHWALAIKFNESRAVTEVEAVYFTVGRTGVVTPVVEYAPVVLASAVCRKATLHSVKQLQTLGVAVGDKIEVTRSGDTIPYVLRSESPREITAPERCPCCNSDLVIEGKETLVCPNQWNCPAQFEGVLIYQVGRDVLDAEGISEKSIQEMLATGEFSDIVSFWSLPEDLDRVYRVMNKARWGAPRMRRTLEAIKKARHTELYRVLLAAGIPNFGEQTCRKLAARYGSLKAVLEAIDRRSICAHLFEHQFRSILKSSENVEFLRYALGAFSLKNPTSVNQEWGGKVFALTGSLQTMSRTAAKNAIGERGGQASSSITKDTQIVIAGDNAGKKLDQARKKGLEVWDENEFERQLKGALT